MVLWVADCIEHVLALFKEKHPHGNRPQKAIEACRAWVVTGVFKMTLIRRALFDFHAAARQAKDKPVCFATRAVGHAVAISHVSTHSIGTSIYAIKAGAAKTGNQSNGLATEHEWQLQRLSEYAKIDLISSFYCDAFSYFFKSSLAFSV